MLESFSNSDHWSEDDGWCSSKGILKKLSKVWGESNLLIRYDWNRYHGSCGKGLTRLSPSKDVIGNNRLGYGCDPSQEYHESSLSPPMVLSFHY